MHHLLYMNEAHQAFYVAHPLGEYRDESALWGYDYEKCYASFSRITIL